jgi:hypothetical protein
MKRSIFLLTLLILSISLFGKEVTPAQAKAIAKSFILSNPGSGLKSTVTAELSDAGDIFARVSPSHGKQKKNLQVNRDVYLFNIGENSGFIVVSGDDAAYPILGYSFSGHVDPENAPGNVIKWLEGYRKQIQYVKTNGIKPSDEIAAIWNLDIFSLKTSQASVSPLVKTQWDQSPYVNDMCPYDGSYDERAVTGCPATAMAQIMKFWNYPAKGTGFHSYQHNKYGTLSANFGTTYYNWSAMPDVIDSPNEAVATLMYHCGIAVEMDYNVAEEGGSGSYVIKDPGGSYSDEQTVEYALVTYFGYSSTVKGIERASYSDSEWKNILKTELNAGRPVQYAGYGQGGHTFVCDGYDTNDFFHMNWGWGGYYDGFFMLDALNPGTGGIGSGAGNFNEDQQALIGIKPPETSLSYKLRIYSDVSLDAGEISYGEGFTVSTDIVNQGTGSFTGDYCAAVFDANDVFVDYVEIKQGLNLGAGNHYSAGISFTTEGMLSILPGKYNVYVFYRPTGGEWDIINAPEGNTATADYAELDVINDNAVSLYSEINVLTDQIYAGDSLSVWLDVANFSAEDFSGILDVSLYNLEGDFVATVEEKTGMTLSSNSHYVNGLTFATAGIDVEPGTYLLALLHQWEGYDYELTGSSGSYVNPVKVIVQEKPFSKDIYEDNDDMTNAYELSPVYSSGKAKVQTTGSNIHVGNDWDFYAISLEDGYNYDINIRIHDLYNSGNGNTYSVDALFLYSLDGVNWSETYDDLMPSMINSPGNRTLYCEVSPYFLGNTGTYLLEINLSRTVSNAVPLPLQFSGPEIYPVPARDNVRIKSAENILEYRIYDALGKEMQRGNEAESAADIDISALPGGIYLVMIKTETTNYYRKIVKE